MGLIHDRSPRRIATATLVAAVLSGIPSTVWAIVSGADPMAATRAAGTILPGGRPSIWRGVLAHVGISILWTGVLAGVLPRRNAAGWGAAAGLAIAGLDLGIIGRRLPAVRALPIVPQVADHLAFGAIVGALIDR